MLPFEVVVDDASIDGTPDVVRRLAEEVLRGTRLHLEVLPENAGASRARNVGLARCRCAYVAFLDSDDRWTPDFLEASVDALERPARHTVWLCAGASFAKKPTACSGTSRRGMCRGIFRRSSGGKTSSARRRRW